MEHFIRIAVWITLLTLSGCRLTLSGYNVTLSGSGYNVTLSGYNLTFCGYNVTLCGYNVTLSGYGYNLTLSGCLQTKSLRIWDFGAEYMRKEVNCKYKSKLYTPGNVTDQCITTALDCVRQELNGTVRDECKDPEERIDDAVAFLDGLIEERLRNGQVLKNPKECNCMDWPEMPFSKFLDETISLLQQIQTSTSSSKG